MKTIKVDYDRIVNELKAIDEEIFIDLIVDNYAPGELVNAFSDLFERNKRMIQSDYVTICGILATAILSGDPIRKEIMRRLIEKNNKYVSNSSYPDMSEEQLKEEFDRDICVGLEKYGITPEMLILYYFSNNVFKGERIEFLKNSYEEILKKIQEARSNAKDEEIKRVERFVDEVLTSYGHLKVLLSSYLRHDYRITSDTYDLMREYFDFERIENKGKIIINEGILVFLYNELLKLEDLIQQADKIRNLVFRIAYKASDFISKTERVFRDNRILMERISKLENENRRLRREIKKYEDKLKEQYRSKETDSRVDEMIKLIKENEQLKYRIQKLEETVALYEEEQQSNKYIVEDLKLDVIPIDSKVSYDIPSYSDVVVLGGRWNSKTKGEVEVFFNSYNSNVEFIESDKILRNFDMIKNADMIIFDTSYNAHTYFYKVKSLKKRLLIINKSSLDAIKELFKTKQDL